MKLKRVEIVNFYSYRSYAVEIRNGLFNVWGLNGQGKTSLQLAIRLGLGWSPSTRGDETLENAIHEDAEQCRIALIFDNSDIALRGYPEEVRTERYIIRGDSKPRMRMTNQAGELVNKSQLDIREDFSKLGYDPDDPGIFIEQGDLRSFYTFSFSKLLEKCIGLAGLRDTNEKVKQTERAFSQIEEVKREIQQTISEMEDDLERYRQGHDAHTKFCEFDDDLKRIELENKAIQYHKKRIESLLAQGNMQEAKEIFEKYKSELEIGKIIVDNAKESIQKFKKEQEILEEHRGNLSEVLEGIYNDKNRKLQRQKELEELIPRLNNPNLLSIQEAKEQVNKTQKEISSIYSKLTKQQDEFQKVKSQLADKASGLALGIVPSGQKILKKRLMSAGIKTEFLADCLEIKKGAENFQEKLEILFDPFKFHLVLQKKDLQKAIEILKDEKEVGIIVPDDWSPANCTGHSASDFLVVKEYAPKELRNFLTYFILDCDKEYGPKNRAFLEPSIRFHRIHLSAHPQNSIPAIGEEGRRIACELAEAQKNLLEIDINELTSEIKRLRQELEIAKETLDFAEKKPNIEKYEKELITIQNEIKELKGKLENILSNNNDFERKIGELKQRIQQQNQLIIEKNLPVAESRVINYEKHYQDTKRKLDDLMKETELFQKDCEPEYIEKFNGFTEDGLTKAWREKDKKIKEIKKSIDELEKMFTREQAKADFHAFEGQKSLIEEKKGSFRKQQEQANQLRVEWDKAQQAYKRMATQLFSRASLIFRDLYKKQDENSDAQIIPNFNIMPPELDVRINIGKRKRLVLLNAKVGGPSGGERLGAIVNLIVSILKARSELAKIESDLYRPQPFIFIDEPQQDMDDPAFRNAILNFKEVMEDTQIVILTHKSLPDPELWQLWLFLHPDHGTLGLSHRGDFHKLVDKNDS